MFLTGFLKIIAPGDGVLVRLFFPRGQGFALSLCPGDGEFALSKKFPGGLPGGMVRSELTDTLHGGDAAQPKITVVHRKIVHCFEF